MMGDVLFTAKTWMKKSKRNRMLYDDFASLCRENDTTIDKMIDKGYLYTRGEYVELTVKGLVMA